MATYVTRVETDTTDLGLAAQITIERLPDNARPVVWPRPQDLPPDIRDALAAWLQK